MGFMHGASDQDVEAEFKRHTVRGYDIIRASVCELTPLNDDIMARSCSMKTFGQVSLWSFRRKER